MTPDELWEKYGPPKDGNSPLYAQGRIKFLAALKEYGAAVRKRDAEIARELHVGEQDDITRDAKYKSAAAIEGEPLP